MIKIRKKEFCFIFTILSLLIASLCEVKAMEEERLIHKPLSKKKLRKEIRLIGIVEMPLDEMCNKFNNDELSDFEALPIELKECILNYLPGDNLGLNYLIRCKNFYPTQVIAEKIQAGFLTHLRDTNGPLTEPLAYAVIHFFETPRKRQIDRLFSLFTNSFWLDRAIPAKAKKSWCSDSKEDLKKINLLGIEDALKCFVKDTKSDWDKLYEKTKSETAFSDYCLIRKKIIEYFAARLKQYFKKNLIVDCSQRLCNFCRDDCKLPFNPTPLVPGGTCCAIGGINTVTGFFIWSCSEFACIFLTILGGFGCAFLGGVMCCLVYDPNCDNWSCCEIIHKKPSEYCICCQDNEGNAFRGYSSDYYHYYLELKRIFKIYAQIQDEERLA